MKRITINLAHIQKGSNQLHYKELCQQYNMELFYILVELLVLWFSVEEMVLRSVMVLNVGFVRRAFWANTVRMFGIFFTLLNLGIVWNTFF